MSNDSLKVTITVTVILPKVKVQESIFVDNGDDGHDQNDCSVTVGSGDREHVSDSDGESESLGQN